MELTAPYSQTSLLRAHTHSCRVSVILLSSLAFSSFVGRASAGTFTLFPSCLLPRLARCRSALAAMFHQCQLRCSPESRFGHFRLCSVIDSSRPPRNINLMSSSRGRCVALLITIV
ncbi:hypothetical protein GOODEAATRI_030728 [Goodea atripinnis]|uniref:Secreted protein n=1 Tax=Goodea atripinnis TaxID=208336 RepID=A0ABV0P927_9TELE